MRKPLRRQTTFSLVASLALHGAALAAGFFASQALRHNFERAKFSGQPRAISLSAKWAEPRFESPALQMNVPSPEMTVTPHEARTGERVYVDRTAAELRLPRPDLAASDLVAQEFADHPVASGGAALAQPPETFALAAAPGEACPLPRDPRTAALASQARLTPPVSAGQVGIARPDFSNNPPPPYPEVARQNGWQGTVLLQLSISAQGFVSLVEVERSSGHPVLDAAAVMAVRQWRGQPARVEGRNVATRELQEIRFRLP